MYFDETISRAFSALRRDVYTRSNREAPPVLFQVLFLKPGAVLRTIDKRGDPLETDYRAYSGLTRDLLRMIDYERLTAAEDVSWDDQMLEGLDDYHSDSPLADKLPGDLLLLEQSALVRLLVQSECLVDEQLRPLKYVPQVHRLQLLLTPAEADTRLLQAELELVCQGASSLRLENPRMLSDGVLCDGTTLYSYEPLGPNGASLSLFLEAVRLDQLEQFLTLFVSTLPTVALAIPGYSVEAGEVLAARPAIIFHEVDPAGTLILSTHFAVANLPPEFSTDYDISRIALIDHERHTVVLRTIDFQEAHQAEVALFKTFRAFERKHRSESNFMAQDGNRWLLSSELAQEFIKSEMHALVANFTLFGTNRLRRYKIVHSTPKLNLRLTHGIQFLDGDGDLELEGERFSILEALSQYRKNRYITLADGNQAVVDADYMARLERLFQKRKDGIRVSFFDLPVLEELIGEAAAAASFPQAREVFRGMNSIQKRKFNPQGFHCELRPYQKAGLQWLDYLCEQNLGACLADDMGLGKTVQTIALLTKIANKTAPVLIVMPRSLLFNWTRELNTFAPGLDHVIHYGVGRDWEAAVQHAIILTTYGTLRSDVETIAKTEFRAVILDESQAIKNPQTQTARAAFTLRASFRLALSGTPVENHLGEVYALFRFLNPGMFASAAEFDRYYATPIQKNNDSAAAADLRRKVYPFILRRLKGDVLKELPPKVEQILWVEMDEAQKNFYEERRRHYKRMVELEVAERGIAAAQFTILEAMLELRQIATVPETRVEDGSIPSCKRERILEAIDEAVGNGRKCLVFSNFLAGVEQVCEALNGVGIEYERMTGSTSNRQERVERFQNDPRVKVFVMTLKTGGVGLNLTAADTVFILDPWWNTSAESQAVDRAHRIGQAQTVFTYRLIARGTIEEKILELQQRKKELVDQIVASDNAAFKSLSEADIDHLFDA